MYIIHTGPQSFEEVKLFLRNDTFRIISHYDIEKINSLGFYEALAFFEDSGTNFPEKDVYDLYGEDIYKRLYYNDIFMHLIEQLKKNIYQIYRFFQYYFEEFDSYIITSKEIEELFKKQSIVRINPRMAALNLILRVNGNDHLVTNIHKINTYIDFKLREHDRKVLKDLEKEFKKEKRIIEGDIEYKLPKFPKFKQSILQH
ncbi:hypothetical protein ACTFIR_005644 [Dictyostelium discoideum]